MQNSLTSLVVASLVVAFAVGYAASGPQVSQDADSQNSVEWYNEITVSKNGEQIAQFHNVLTDQGKNWIRSQIANVGSGDVLSAETANATYIALGDGNAPAAGDVQLDGEIASAGLSRTAGGVTTFAAGEFQVQNTFTASSNYGVVNTTSLNWNSSGPSMVSGGTFSADANLQNGDQLTVTHNITIS